MSDPIDEPNEIADDVGVYDEEERRDEENEGGDDQEMDSSEEEEEDDEEEMAKVSQVCLWSLLPDINVDV